MATTQIVARIPTDLAERFGLLAQRSERTFSAELRLAMRAHLDAVDAQTQTRRGGSPVNLLAVLRDELLSYRAGLRDAPAGARVFGSSTGGRHSAMNVRRRILAPAVEIANRRLDEDGIDPLADRLTPHSLRRTFASIVVALGEDPAYVIGQLGHTDPKLTLRIYARAMQRRDGERDRLRALVGGREWAPMGTSNASETIAAGEATAA